MCSTRCDMRTLSKMLAWLHLIGAIASSLTFLFLIFMYHNRGYEESEAEHEGKKHRRTWTKEWKLEERQFTFQNGCWDLGCRK